MADASDDFNRAAIGANWTAGLNGGITISASTVAIGAVDNNATSWWNANPFLADHYSQATRTDSDDGGGPLVRHQSGANTFYSFAAFSGTEANIYECTAGSFAALGATFAGTFSATHTMKLDATGGTLTAYNDGGSLGTRTDTTITGGAAGLHIFDNTTPFDDWIGGPIPVLSLTNTDDSFSTTDDDVYSFTSQAFGAVAGAGETRYIVVAVSHTSLVGETNDSVDIGGVAATNVATAGGGGTAQANIWIAAVPTGTTGTVEVTMSGTVGGCRITVYRLIDPLSSTPHDTGSDATHASGVLDVSLDVPVGGASVACCQIRNNTSVSTTWAGQTEIGVDTELDANDPASHAMGWTAGAPRTVTATSSDTTPQAMAACSASWAPTPASTPFAGGEFTSAHMRAYRQRPAMIGY